MNNGGLILRLRPYEKFLVNGVVIENGDKRVRLRIKSQDANILRLRDAMHPDEATSPVKRLYYVAQLVVTGDTTDEEARLELIRGFESLYDALPNPAHQEMIDLAKKALSEGDFYRVMRALRPLIEIEQQLLLVARARQLDQASQAVG